MTVTRPATLTRSGAEILAWSRDLVEPALRAAVDRLPESTRRVAGYHHGWWDEHGRPIGAATGKALRPALALLSASAVGGLPERAVPAAVAVELVHGFSLLHDDVMDGDTTRRHRPTAWVVFGRDAAILAGDALLALAFQALAAGGPPGLGRPGSTATWLLVSAVQRLLDGQHADLEFEGRADVDLADCQRMAAGKTGALLGCACALGARFGRGTDRQVDQLALFGEQLGLAFQAVDDLLGIWGDPAVTGKPVHSDLRSRKKSFPVVAALASGTEAGERLRERQRRRAVPSESELDELAGLVDAAGGRAWTRGAVDDLLSRAMNHLTAAAPGGPAGADLRTLAAYVTRRER